MSGGHYFHPCIFTEHDSFPGFKGNVCQHCQKGIIDLTEVESDKLQELVEKLEAGTCVKLGEQQLGLCRKFQKSIQVLAIGSLLLGACRTNKIATNSTSKPEIPSDTTNLKQSKNDIFIGVVIEKMPKLIGGIKGLEDRLQYPGDAIINDVKGTVYVQFKVDTTGNVKDVRVVKSLYPSCDKEAIRLVKTAKFTPGYQRGKPVSVMFSIPVRFKLPGK